ncbi:MAG: DUF4142 domain-containing protein [Sphingomonas bacterium]|nr:DUF4142 domain-containing protein [Sphingomonas bacterium]
MRTTWKLCLGAVSTALLLTACQTGAPSPRQPSSRPPSGGGVALAPADYVATAASIDLFVVKAAELALDRSGNYRVRALASSFSESHRGLAGQLSFAGRRVDTLPSARLLPREAERLAALQTQQPFDATFLRQMILTHEQSLALHGNFAVRGSSPTLRPVAASAERVERAHLDELRRQ